MAEIVIDGLTSRRTNSPALNRVNLRIRNGEVLVLAAADPAGSSLLLDVLDGRATPDEGRVLVDGVPMPGAGLDRGSRLVRLGERSAIVAETVWSAVRAAAGANHERAQRAIRNLGLADLVSLPVSELSESDRRRVDVAVALVGHPEYLLLDQPAADLAPHERSVLPRALGAALTDPSVTAVYATTNAEEALRVGDRIAYLSGDGEIVQVGTPAQLAANPASLEIAKFVGGDRLQWQRGYLAGEFFEGPSGRLEGLPPAGGGRDVIVGAWPLARAPRIRAAQGTLDPIGAAPEHPFLFDAMTGERLDRVQPLQTSVSPGKLGGYPRRHRHLNVTLSSRRGGRALPSEAPLHLEHDYWLELWIGARAPMSIVENTPAHAFPDAILPDSAVGHVVQVVAHGDVVRVVRPAQELLLPAHGSSARLAFRFQTPTRAGSGTIRLALWYRRHLLQSALVELRWGKHTRGPSHTAFIDYTLSDLDDVARFPERDLSLVVNETATGVHRILVNGRDEEPFAVTLFERDMAGRLSAARETLLAAHRDSATGATRYDPRNAKGRDAFVADLTELAHAGAALLEVAFPNAKRRNKLVRRLRQASAERGGRAVVQVAQAAGSQLQFPWQLVYDIGLEVFAKESDRPCRVLERWPLEAEGAELPLQCPHLDEHALNTICPYGFWGFAHVLELPPSTLDPGSSMPLCVRDGPPRSPIVVGVSDRLNEHLTARHLERLRGELSCVECDTVDAFRTALSEPERELVYLYCHGRRAYLAAYGTETSLLEIGDNGYIATGDIAAWSSLEGGWGADHWQATKPLVIINGCHTAAVSPLEPVDFVSAFMGAGAGGVVGTEVMLDQPVASEAAEGLVAGLLRAALPVGEALQGMRRRLLAKGNVMGLAYTAYCSAGLTMRCPGP